MIYENKTYNIKPDGNVVVAIIPPKAEHYLITKTDIKYYVIRDQESKTIYLD